MFSPQRVAAISQRARRRLARDPFLLTDIAANLHDKLASFGLLAPGVAVNLVGTVPPDFMNLPSSPAQNPHGPYNAVLLINTLHSIDDIPRALFEATLTLTPGGVLMGAVFGEETLRELEYALLHVEEQMFGRVSPRCMPKLDIKTMGQLLRHVGMSHVITDKETYTINYATVVDLVHDSRTLGLSNALVDAAGAAPRGLWAKTEHHLLAGATTFPITFEVIYFTAFQRNKGEKSLSGAV